MQQRFDKFTDRRGLDDCWEWLGAIKREGYGNFKIGVVSDRAHRASWMIYFGPIPDGLFVLHRCDNRSCVNPNHLFLGDNDANMADMRFKGRRKNIYCGEVQHDAKLTAENVIEMRQRWAAGESAKSLGIAFGVTQSTARKAAKKEHWKHIP